VHAKYYVRVIGLFCGIIFAVIFIIIIMAYCALTKPRTADVTVFGDNHKKSLNHVCFVFFKLILFFVPVVGTSYEKTLFHLFLISTLPRFMQAILYSLVFINSAYQHNSILLCFLFRR